MRERALALICLLLDAVERLEFGVEEKLLKKMSSPELVIWIVVRSNHEIDPNSTVLLF